MPRPHLVPILVACLGLTCAPALRPGQAASPPRTPSIVLPPGYASAEQVGRILDRTLSVRLAPELSRLSAAEHEVLGRLLQVGEIFQRLYESSRHSEALEARAALEAEHRRLGAPRGTADLLELYRLSQGPIVTTLENERTPFLPVAQERPGRNVYPADAERSEIEEFLAASPQARREILHPRTVVRRTAPEMVARDLGVLDAHPVLDTLHLGLRERLESLTRDETVPPFYGVPYSVAYADALLEAYHLLVEASEAASAEDPDLSSYLRLRARDLLSDDYEAGDAAWVRGDLPRLNAEIGSYETYDDKLFGVKTFFAVSLLLRDEQQSARLARATRELQALQDDLPYPGQRRVRSDIPVGVYRVIADFGQARGTNTATILPNDSAHARKYGRTILMRANILLHPELYSWARAIFRSAVASAHRDDLTLEGGFQRTLWHEIGHYLGPDRTRDGRTLDEALLRYSDLVEELKSDLVALHVAPALRRDGLLDEAELRGVYSSGIFRVLQRVRPRRDQPYQTMQLMQMNFFLERGLLRYEQGRLRIDYSLYHEVVSAMLERVLAIQWSGDPTAAAAFVERYGEWHATPHEALATTIRETNRYPYRLVRYAALGE